MRLLALLAALASAPLGAAVRSQPLAALGRLAAGRGAAGAALGEGARRSITAVILGPPGGGKGTISKRLIKDFGFYHLSTGDMLREQVRVGSELGKAAKEHMAAGRLVPDSLITDIVLKTVADSTHEHILLDGFPRTVPQATALTDRGVAIGLALDLAVPFDEIVRRTSGRWVHLGSGRTYAYDFNPPAVEGVDDVTGEPLVQREDDTPEAVRARLQVYSESATPLVEHYSQMGVLARFDGEDQPELVAKDRRSDAIYASLHPYVAERLNSTVKA